MSEILNELLDEQELLEVERKEWQAVELDQQIKVYANLAWQNLIESAKCLKTMRDSKLYLELGYTDFEDYTEKSLGIKQRQAYTYIKAYEDLGERFIGANAGLGITKLGMLAQLPPTDRDEFVENHDLAGMSVDEVKKLISENDQRGEQINLLTEERDRAVGEKDELAEKLEEIKNNNEDLSKEIEELEAELEAEKNKPSEVAVREPSAEEIEKIKAEASAQTKAELEKVHKKEIKEVKDAALEKATDQFRKSLDEARANVQSLTADKEELIKKREELQKQLLVSSTPDAVKFSFYSEALQDTFKKLFECIVTVREQSPETAEKYKDALIKYYVSLEEQIRGI